LFSFSLAGGVPEGRPRIKIRDALGRPLPVSRGEVIRQVL